MSDVSDLLSPARLVLPVFEGPLDLLLHLVKVNEMEIHDIEIAEITRQYLAYLDAMSALNLEVAGDFMVMAATLINIKSRSILPRQEGEAGEVDEEEIDDIVSTQELIRRLVEYRKFKEISSSLRILEDDNNGVFYRSQVLTVVPGREEEELPRQDIRALYDAFAQVLKRVRVDPRHTVYRERFSVDEKLVELREVLRRDKKVNFTRLLERSVVKEEAICLFLAILEMAKLREITVAQADTYEDILLAPWDENVIYAG